MKWNWQISYLPDIDVLLQFSKGVKSSQFSFTSKLSEYSYMETMVTSITSLGLHSK